MRCADAVRWAVAGGLLAAAGLLALASNGGNEPEVDACCSCLARERNAYDEPCITQTTTQCVEQTSQGMQLNSCSYCLREKCGEPCREFVAALTPLEELQDCCACLDQGDDPSGEPCLNEGVDAEACVTAIDNGGTLRSTRACYYDVCRGRCTFLQVSTPDAGLTEDAS